jgi:hypothetical protein
MKNLSIEGMDLEDYKVRPDEHIIYHAHTFTGAGYTLELDFRQDAKNGVIYWANGLLKHRERGLALNIYNAKYSGIDVTPTKLGVNWGALGTQPVEVTKQFGELLTIGANIAEQINNQLGV